MESWVKMLLLLVDYGFCASDGSLWLFTVSLVNRARRLIDGAAWDCLQDAACVFD